ncbi:MAG: hypothetical protein U5L45_02275 [Saprospiraceae bacterium]|nr:hypothetical protein [Saprospiraceae bacterium]
MKNSLLIIFLSVFASFAHGQADGSPDARIATNIKWSNELEEPTNTSIRKIIATEGGGFYALRERQGGLLGGGTAKPLIEYYNANMKLVRSKELDLNVKGKTRLIKDVVMLNGRLWVLSYFYNEKHEKTYLFAQEVNKSTLNLAKDLVKIAEQDQKNADKSDVFTVATSRDSSKIVIFNRQPKADKQQEFSLVVYDGNFKELWSKDAKLPYSRKNFTIEDHQLDNEGNVYLLGIIYTEGAARLERRGKATYQYDIVAYRRDNTTTESQEYKIDMKDRFVSDLSFKIEDNGDLVCAGFYSEKGAKSIKGACFFKINPKTQDQTSISSRPFDFEFMTTNLSERNKERAKAAIDRGDKSAEPELYDYSIDKLITRSDGGVIMVAEQYFIDERLRYNNNGFGGGLWGNNTFYDPYSYRSIYDPYGRNNNNNRRPDYYFHYNDIIVVNIQPDGEIAWTARVPKRQESVNDYGQYSSYGMSIVADKLCFIYNDDPKNLDPRAKKIQTENPDKYSVVTVAEVDRNGAVNRAPLFQNKEQGVVVRPKLSKQVGRRDMAIYGESGRRYKFGVLTFE